MKGEQSSCQEHTICLVGSTNGDTEVNLNKCPSRVDDNELNSARTYV